MYSRPKPSETDEDLLQLQEEFNKQKVNKNITPAAKVVNTQKEETQAEEQTTEYDIEDQLANTFEAIPQNSHIGNIVEKQPPLEPSSIVQLENRGFPKAKRRDISLKSNEGGSIFAQQMKKLKTHNQPHKSSISRFKQSNLPSESYILSGNDKNEIHQENVQKLKTMSEKEILEEKQNLLSTMDPALIAFLKSRRSKQPTTANISIEQQEKAAENLTIDNIETTKEILDKPQADRWLNFSHVEMNKLAWMKNVESPKIDKKQAFEARFDFEGWLMPYDEPQMTEKTRILYHHGEDAARPGYTLQELFQLARSEVMQQKVVALNTIANLLALYGAGIYVDIIELPIEQIFFVLRFCLDDNTPTVLNAAIKAMRNLIYNEVDETCLDFILNFNLLQIQPILAVDHNEDDNTINDQQLVESNLIKCLARTEILTRIRYILTIVKPPLETLVNCLDILVRLARDSDLIVQKIWKDYALIQTIIDNFLPKTTSKSKSGMPLYQAIKFMRILSSRNKKFAIGLLEKYRIMDSIVIYLSSDIYSSNTNGLKLQSECLKLWKIFVYYGLSLDIFQLLTPVLMEMLNYHLNHTDLSNETTYIRQTHVSSLINLLNEIGRKNVFLIQPYLEKLKLCFIKWNRQFMKLNKSLCGKLQIISALYSCVTTFIGNNAPGITVDSSNEFLASLIKSNGFSVVTKNVLNGSMLLNNYKINQSSSNLKTVETTVWYSSEHTIPIIQTTSCLPFLCALSNYIVKIAGKTEILLFLKHPNIEKYLENLMQMERYHLTSNWFTKIESTLIMNVLKASLKVKESVDLSKFYSLAIKSLNIFSYEQKSDIAFILEHIIFERTYYPEDVMLRNLNIHNEALELSLNNLGEISKVYSQVLNLNNNLPDFSGNLSLDIGSGNLIPIDWIYTPIIILYSNQQQNKDNLKEFEQFYLIKNCLRWILIYETYFPVLASLINSTDRFCRIACVFLASDNLFLHNEIHNLLEICLKNVITNYEDKIDFDQEIEGLNDFQTFYTQLLEQYQGVSYGDILFGNFILIPLAQRHNVQWKKTLWSEYMGVVETFNVTKQQSICPVESFLNPAEEDKSLIKCYKKALINNSIRQHSILYLIAKHHVEQFIVREKK